MQPREQVVDDADKSAAAETKDHVVGNGKGGADIADFDTVASCEEGSLMEVRNPKTQEVFRHDDGRPFTIRMRGKHADTFVNMALNQTDRRTSATMRTRAPVPSRVIQKDDIELLVTSTISWDVVLDGKIPKSDAKEYRAAYTKYPWLKEQVDEFVGGVANFIKTE